MVRDTGEGYHEHQDMIAQLAEAGFKHHVDYEVLEVPNITNITYGRDVGYTITEETFDAEVEAISGTDIRADIDKIALLGEDR
jgi:hypothetical protein